MPGQSNRIDRSEAAIIRLLQVDGRMSTTELARQAGVSEPTVRKKLNRLLSDGVIRVAAIADPIDLGYAAPVYIGLDVDRPNIETVAAALAEYPQVSSVAIATGPHDVIIEAAFRSIPELYHFVLEELAKFKDIKDSNSFFVLKRAKQAGLTGVAAFDDVGAEASAGHEDDPRP